jgi:hypothetical protein
MEIALFTLRFELMSSPTMMRRTDTHPETGKHAMKLVHQSIGRLIILGVVAFGTVGCGSSAPTHTGFISDYSMLQRVDKQKARYVSTKLAEYHSFMVDPVQMRAGKDSQTLSAQERAEVANYMHEAFVKSLRDGGYTLASQPGIGVARVRLAITDVQESNWALNLLPTTKLTGAGTGGASMEGEVIDAVTGEQLAAVVKTGRGNQFELDTFDKLDDIKDVIDAWAKEAETRLRELRQ